MFAWLRYCWRLWGINREERRIRSAFSKLRKIAKAKAELGEESSTDWLAKEIIQISLTNDEREGIKTDYLVDRARRYGVPVPDRHDQALWFRNEALIIQYLRPQAFADLRSAIRRERNEVWQFWELRMKVLVILFTAATGAIGALIGLIAIWK